MRLRLVALSAVLVGLVCTCAATAVGTHVQAWSSPFALQPSLQPTDGGLGGALANAFNAGAAGQSQQPQQQSEQHDGKEKENQVRGGHSEPANSGTRDDGAAGAGPSPRLNASWAFDSAGATSGAELLKQYAALHASASSKHLSSSKFVIFHVPDVQGGANDGDNDIVMATELATRMCTLSSLLYVSVVSGRVLLVDWPEKSRFFPERGLEALFELPLDLDYGKAAEGDSLLQQLMHSDLKKLFNDEPVAAFKTLEPLEDVLSNPQYSADMFRVLQGRAGDKPAGGTGNSSKPLDMMPRKEEMLALWHAAAWPFLFRPTPGVRRKIATVWSALRRAAGDGDGDSVVNEQEEASGSCVGALVDTSGIFGRELKEMMGKRAYVDFLRCTYAASSGKRDPVYLVTSEAELNNQARDALDHVLVHFGDDFNTKQAQAASLPRESSRTHSHAEHSGTEYQGSQSGSLLELDASSTVSTSVTARSGVDGDDRSSSDGTTAVSRAEAVLTDWLILSRCKQLFVTQLKKWEDFSPSSAVARAFWDVAFHDTTTKSAGVGLPHDSAECNSAKQ